jgi:uncharacterized protein with HEPN domain
MFKKLLITKIDFILEMIENINKIVKRHKGIVKAINDYEGQMAILMGISQVGETLKKIDDEILEKYDLVKDKEGAYYTRNYIVHDYEGVDLAFIEDIVRNYLPSITVKINNIKKDLE